ncbi:hypothetical protein HPT25_19040 [Bacillus sp. BRMEA1]|uniref:hypothetical protein n=1 Tax=Neobacillus endophyticus TaxID=2738405 RepID=UPI0015632B4C|nr:hypothetical protein [Neobacillus endophyticus]NRD79461.1 hypothetical protein [Neobacillus endophyticus]
MVNQQTHVGVFHKSKYLPPKGEYQTFLDEEHFKEKLKEWGLSAAKKEFWYKDRNYQELVSIQGYESYGITGEYHTLVIQFPDGALSCIHPAFLKEMQQSSFGKESIFSGDGSVTEGDAIVTSTEKTPLLSDSKSKQALEGSDTGIEKGKQSKKESKPKKEKTIKIQLPEEKVHFTAEVKQFALTYNPFNEENDEVVVLEHVTISQEPPIELGFAWCSHSKTLKKFELVPGDLLEFDGKVASKKLAKGKDVEEEFIVEIPVMYKINNPSKIVKNG